MVKLRLAFFIFGFGLTLMSLYLSCNTSSAPKAILDEAKTDTITGIYLPQVPVTIVSDAERAVFLTRHYWDNFNFRDTNYLHHSDLMKQAWGDYNLLLVRVSKKEAEAALKRTMEQAEVNKKMLMCFAEYAEKSFYDPNSPLRNEDYYLIVLESLINSPLLDSIEKVRPQTHWYLANKNRVGEMAADFKFQLLSGKEKQLYTLTSPYTLLFFSNPTCEACGYMVNQLYSSPIVGTLVQEGKLTVLTIYPDEDVNLWCKHLQSYPGVWLNGYDKQQTIRKQQLYDLKAIPTLYLLDHNKMVILKDARVQELLDTLEAIE